MNLLVAPLVLALLAAPGAAERVQVYSIQGADCAECGERLLGELRKIKGIKKASFDKRKVELTVRMEDGLGDAVVRWQAPDSAPICPTRTIRREPTWRR